MTDQKEEENLTTAEFSHNYLLSISFDFYEPKEMAGGNCQRKWL